IFHLGQRVNVGNFHPKDYKDLKESFHEAVRDARKTILGPLSPGCNMLCTIQKRLYKMLPENSHQVASGRLHISLTRVMDGQNVMVSEFSSKEDLIQALICSCFVPIYCGFIPPSFRGVRYVDGGFTNLQPCSDLEAVITVSPFTGELDICPRDCPAIFYSFQIFNSSIQISVENLCRISYALFPPSYLVSGPYQCAPVLLNGLGYTCELQCNKGAPGALAHSPFTLARHVERSDSVATALLELHLGEWNNICCASPGVLRHQCE
uniref:PNPLA domain-containing protein n=1 Tax=Gopherus evgoodei TaxID=1825980 RepID=A0A8C4VIC4_9SAUR